MIHLTDKHIAVEILESATDLEISYENPTHLVYKFGAEKIHDGFIKAEIVGVTPLTEGQAKRIVEALTEKSLSMTLLHGYKNYDLSKKYGSSYPFMQASKSFNSLLKSKGLDPNKKYAIIKIEKE